MPGRNGDSKGLSDLAKDTQELAGSGLNSGLIDLRDPGMILRFADPESESSSPSGSGPHLPPYYSSLPASSALIKATAIFPTLEWLQSVLRTRDIASGPFVWTSSSYPTPSLGAGVESTLPATKGV